MSEMVSFGAGVNSVAATIRLVLRGWRGPIVLADPGAEDPDTYCYLSLFERWLGKFGLTVTRLSPETNPELYTPSYRMPLLAKCKSKGIVPIMFNRWCTTEYKRVPLTRWAKANGIDTQFIGISTEERHRAARTETAGIALEYPLLDWGWSRRDCKEFIASVGLPVPPKSGCWFCPFQSRSDWRRLYDCRPDLFEQAIELDEAAITNAGRPDILMQLGEGANIRLKTAKLAWDSQMPLPGMPQPQYEYQMCECRL